MKPHIPALAVAAVLAAPACVVNGTSNCTPTRIRATEATKVNVGTASRSSIVEARLTASDGPLAGRTLTFEILDDGASVYTATSTTGRDGVARADLKRADADALLAIVRGDQFSATFDGDGTYCQSFGNAGFRAVR